MAKVQLKNEWRLWGTLAIVAALVVAYLYFASRPPTEGGEYLWKVISIEGPNELTLRGSGSVIKVRLIGLKTPSSEEEAARKYLTKTLANQWVRVKTVREEADGLKLGFVYLSGDDINARMVRSGLAEIDRGDKAFDVRPFIELEQEAKRQKRGLWGKKDQGAK
jgi:endonuclease YncB( thermonuclease family)